MVDAKGRWSPWWFRDQVTSKGPWDFKRIDLLYEDFGNFHYGATGRAFGFSTSVLLREAGRYQVEHGTSRPEWGDPGWRFWGGVPPYGDDPSDQEWIRKGIRYSKCVAQ
jgi:putative RNase toxin 44 of polymorphic toxin system